jgi:fluoride exporter
LINFLYVALGGSIGASLRFSFSLLFKNFLSLNYLFISTLLVNIIGSFLIGYTIFLLESKNITQDFLKYFIIIGILGSFTTFSTFSLESVEMLVDKKIIQAFLYMFFSLTLCLLFTYIGLNLNKIIN